MRTLCLSSAVTAAPPAPSRPRRRWRTAALLLGLAAFCADASAAIFGPAGVQPAYYPSTSAQATEAPSAAVFGDFNNDGYPDAAVIDAGTNTLMIYTGNAIGTLSPTHEYGIFNLSFYDGMDASISTADLDGDGKLDLVIGDKNGVSILLGVGDVSASFVAANPQRPQLPSSMGWGVAKTVLRDINGDGRPDIVMARNDTGGILDPLGVTHVTVLLNAGGGKFGPPDDYSAGTNTTYPNSLVLAPFDGDGVADILFYDAYGSSSKLYFMKGNADGTFQSKQLLMDPAPQGITFGEAVDIDGDGKMDYLMSFGSTMAWLKGNGNGTFQPAQTILPNTNTLHSYEPSARPVVGDFNHDGLPDIAMGGRIFVQQANHTFQQVETVGWGDDTYMLAGADLNGDLRTDLLTSGPDPKHLAVFKTTAGPATHMVLTGGNNQSATFSTAFAAPLTLKVLDANNVGVPNQQITFNGFHGLSAGATLSPGVTYTDAQGNASDTAMANNTIGCYTVQASLANSNVGLTYNLCNTGNDMLSVVGGDNQSTQVNTAFAMALQVKLTTFGNVPKQGVTLTFKAPASGASAALSATTAVTDANGLASVNATANGTAGSYDVQVTAPGGAAPASLHLTNAAAAGSAAQIIVSLAASPQSAPINTAFAPLAVKVVDSAANPVAGATVVYTIGANPTTGAAAVLAAGTAVTDGSGNAQVGATANGFIGNHTVKVSLQGNASVPTQTINLRNYAQLPKAIALVGGTPQSTPTTTKFAQTLSVKLTDANGQPTPQVLVYFLPPASGAGATLSAASALTDANGIAQVTATANAIAGSYQVGAAVFQTSIETPILVAFNLTNTALPPPPPPPQTAVPAPGLNLWGMLTLIGTLLCASALSARFHGKKLEG